MSGITYHHEGVMVGRSLCGLRLSDADRCTRAQNVDCEACRGADALEDERIDHLVTMAALLEEVHVVALRVCGTVSPGEGAELLRVLAGPVETIARKLSEHRRELAFAWRERKEASDA